MLSPPHSFVSSEFCHASICVGADDIVHALVVGYATTGGVQRRMICSEFVLYTYAMVYGASSPIDVPGPSPVFTPSDIYMNKELITVGGP
jgi:hypothetical protein